MTIARPVSAGGRQHFEAKLLVSLEAVGAGPRLVRSAAQAGGPQRLELACQAHDLLFTFDRARAGDHGDPRAANLESACLDHGSLTLEFGRSTLVGSHDRQDFFDPFARLERLGQARALFPKRGDDRLVRSVNHLGLQPQRGDVIRHVLDLQGCCVRFHNYDHGRPSSHWVSCFSSTFDKGGGSCDRASSLTGEESGIQPDNSRKRQARKPDLQEKNKPRDLWRGTGARV